MAALLRWLVQALVRLYYPRRVLQGAERIPRDRPLIFVLNHPNGLLDPMLLGLAVDGEVRFLAKSTLFGNPVGRLAMEAFGCLPVYRQQDEGANQEKNEATFVRCRQALAAGQWLALFPEGTSHSDPQLRPMKTGAARIALSAQRLIAESNETLGIAIVPVGLAYERKATFRSRVLLVVGNVIDVHARLPAYLADERAAVGRLTDDIHAALREVVPEAETTELLEGIVRVASWTREVAGATAKPDLAAQHRRVGELLAAYKMLRECDPERLETISARARDYANTLRRLGVRDPWRLEFETVRLGPAVRAWFALIVSAPVAFLGALLAFPPYRLAGPVAARVTGDEDVLGTVKLLAGAVFVLGAWIAEVAIMAFVAGPWWALGLALVAAPSGYMALRFGETWEKTLAAARHLWLRATRFGEVKQLVLDRRMLADEIAKALDQIKAEQ